MDTGFEDLSTDAFASDILDAAKNGKGKGKAPKDDTPKVSARAVAQAAKLGQAKQAEKAKKSSRDSVLTKLAKIEQYQIHFGGKLKGRYKKISPDSASAEADADLHLAQIEKELGSENAPHMMENIWLLFIKVFSEGYTILGSPYGLRLKGKRNLEDVAASKEWMDRVRTNLMMIQIKYGLFETGPAVQLMVALGGIVMETHHINTASDDPAQAAGDIGPDKQEKYKNL